MERRCALLRFFSEVVERESLLGLLVLTIVVIRQKPQTHIGQRMERQRLFTIENVAFSVLTFGNARCLAEYQQLLTGRHRIAALNLAGKNRCLTAIVN